MRIQQNTIEKQERNIGVRKKEQSSSIYNSTFSIFQVGTIGG
jgi:hypothetical protein